MNQGGGKRGGVELGFGAADDRSLWIERVGLESEEMGAAGSKHAQGMTE